MRLWLGITIFSAVTGQLVDYGNYDYEVSMTGATVDLGPDNRKQLNEYEKGASSPYDRVKKISRQSRDWINEYANNYKKKPRLERAITRFQSRYQNALSADGCKKDPSYEQQRDFDGELSRKLPADPEAKIEKFSKLLDKFHRLYLTGCKKATRLEEVNDRFKRQFLGAYSRMKSCKKCGYGGGGKNDAGVFGSDVEETTSTVQPTTAEPTTTTLTTREEEFTTVSSTTTDTTTSTSGMTTTSTLKATKRPKKNKKKTKTEKQGDLNNASDKFSKPFSG